MLQVHIICPFSSLEKPFACYKKIPFTFSVHVYLTSSSISFPIEKVPFGQLRLRCLVCPYGQKSLTQSPRLLYFTVQALDNDDVKETKQLACDSSISIVFPNTCKCEIYEISMELVLMHNDQEMIPIGFKTISSHSSTSLPSPVVFVNVLSVDD